LLTYSISWNTVNYHDAPLCSASVPCSAQLKQKPLSPGFSTFFSPANSAPSAPPASSPRPGSLAPATPTSGSPSASSPAPSCARRRWTALR